MAPTTSKKELTPEVKAAGIDVRGTQIGELAVGFEEWPVGDYTPLFEGLPHGCEAAHHGYCIAGRGRVLYDDGTSEEIRAGQAYAVRPRHRFEVLEPMRLVEFTTMDGVYEKTVKVVEKNLPAFLAAHAAVEA